MRTFVHDPLADMYLPGETRPLYAVVVGARRFGVEAGRLLAFFLQLTTFPALLIPLKIGIQRAYRITQDHHALLCDLLSQQRSIPTYLTWDTSRRVWVPEPVENPFPLIQWFIHDFDVVGIPSLEEGEEERGRRRVVFTFSPDVEEIQVGPALFILNPLTSNAIGHVPSAPDPGRTFSTLLELLGRLMACDRLDAFVRQVAFLQEQWVYLTFDESEAWIDWVASWIDLPLYQGSPGMTVMGAAEGDDGIRVRLVTRQ